MNTLVNYISEKLIISRDLQINKTNDVPLIRIYELFQLLERVNKTQKDKLARFLKGKDNESALDIDILKDKKYLHIFRYSDQHKISISIVCNDSYKWPNKEEEWKNAVQYNKLDDRTRMEELFKEFYNFIKKEFV